MPVVFVYSDESLREVAELLSERFCVVNYGDDPVHHAGEQSVWLVAREEQASEWPLGGRTTLPVLVVDHLTGESIVTEAWVWLKHRQLI